MENEGQIQLPYMAVIELDNSLESFVNFSILQLRKWLRELIFAALETGNEGDMGINNKSSW